MEAYAAELERTAAFLHTISGCPTESNIKRIGSLNHFEMFEETTSSGRRVSFSGSIVVIDLDFDSEKGIVVDASISLSTQASGENATSFMAAVNQPSKHLLNSLREPRLDRFMKIMEFISGCDRFSTRDINCFQALDAISAAIFKYCEQNPQSDSFGRPELNPQSLGLGLWYRGPESDKKYAYIDISAGTRPQYALRYKPDWLREGGKDWAPSGEPPSDSRAELVLTFDPPAVISDVLSRELGATSSQLYEDIDGREHLSTWTMPRHPKFGNTADEFTIRIANILPFSLVSVSQIPLESPEKIPDILEHVRQAGSTMDLLKSLLRGPSQNIGEIDVSIADAIELKDQAVRSNTIPVGVCLLPGFRLVCALPQGKFDITISKNGIINSDDPILSKITRKSLALAISYFYCMNSGGQA